MQGEELARHRGEADKENHISIEQQPQKSSLTRLVSVCICTCWLCRCGEVVRRKPCTFELVPMLVQAPSEEQQPRSKVPRVALQAAVNSGGGSTSVLPVAGAASDGSHASKTRPVSCSLQASTVGFWQSTKLDMLAGPTT